MDKKIQTALIGGVVLGVLSSIPFINIPNACCCAWALIGGGLAAHLYIKKSEVPVTPADGAILGVIAGAIGAAIYFVIGVPLGYITGNIMMRTLAGLSGQGANMPGMMQPASIAGAFLGGVMWAVLFVIFATIGGLLGTVIFEKRKGGTGGMTPPPPPSNFGGTPPPPSSGFGGNQPGGFGGGNQPGGSGGFGSNQPGGFGGGNQPGGGGGMGGNQPGGFGR